MSIRTSLLSKQKKLEAKDRFLQELCPVGKDPIKFVISVKSWAGTFYTHHLLLFILNCEKVRTIVTSTCICRTRRIRRCASYLHKATTQLSKQGEFSISIGRASELPCAFAQRFSVLEDGLPWEVRIPVTTFLTAP